MPTVGNSPDSKGDVLSWARLENDSGETFLAVFGYPVGHSRSPEMHNAALREMAQENPGFSAWSYFRYEVEPAQLDQVLQRCHRLGVKGINLTVPHKIDVLPLIAAGEKVRLMGAANTLLWSPQGYVGFNTDGIGLLRALERDLSWSPKDRNVLLLGAGGAARGAAFALLEAGVRSLFLHNRSRDRAEHIMRLASEAGYPDRMSLWEEGTAVEPDLILNATSLGLKVTDPLPFDPGSLSGRPLLYDMIYNPAETPFLRRGRELGLKTANGLSMLAFQGIESLRIWTDSRIPELPFFKTLGLA